MSFAEIDLFGVYVAPLALNLVGAWFITTVLRRIAVRVDLLQHTWHPSLFIFSVYIIVLSSWTLIVSWVNW